MRSPQDGWRNERRPSCGSAFQSANPDFTLPTLIDRQDREICCCRGFGPPDLMDTFVRLPSPRWSRIAQIRGCVRGVSSEFVSPATALRVAREHATRPTEVGVGLIPAEAARNVFQLAGAVGTLELVSRRERLRRRHRGALRDTSTGAFFPRGGGKTANWRFVDARARGSPHSTGGQSPPPKNLVTVRCRPPTPSTRRHHFM